MPMTLILNIESSRVLISLLNLSYHIINKRVNVINPIPSPPFFYHRLFPLMSSATFHPHCTISPPRCQVRMFCRCHRVGHHVRFSHRVSPSPRLSTSSLPVSHYYWTSCANKVPPSLGVCRPFHVWSGAITRHTTMMPRRGTFAAS